MKKSKSKDYEKSWISPMGIFTLSGTTGNKNQRGASAGFALGRGKIQGQIGVGSHSTKKPLRKSKPKTRK